MPTLNRSSGPRTRVRTVAVIQRPHGWALEVAVLSRDGSEPCIGIRTSNGNGGGARIQIDACDLDDLEDAIRICRAAARKVTP